MRAFGLERVGRDDEHAPGYFGHGNFPRPLQAAQRLLWRKPVLIANSAMRAR